MVTHDSKKRLIQILKYILWIVLIVQCLVMIRAISWTTADSPYYLDLAKSISSGRYGLLVTDPLRSPGYPVFLWIFAQFLHLPIAVIVFIQMALYLISIFLIQRLLENHGINSSWFLGLLTIYPAAAAFSVPIMTEAVTIALVSIIVFLLSRKNTPSIYSLLASSVLAALAVLTRPSDLGLPIIVCIIGYLRLKTIKPVIFSLLVSIIILLPFAVRNWVEFKKFTPIPVASATGQSLFAATWEGELSYADINSIEMHTYTDVVLKSGILQEFEKINTSIGAPSDITSFNLSAYPSTDLQIAANATFQRAAIERIKINPLSYAWHVIGGWWRLWNTQNYPASLPHILIVFLMITTALVCILGYVGGIYYLHLKFPPLIATFIILLYFPLVACWWHTEARYTAPGRLLIALFASLVIEKIVISGLNVWRHRYYSVQKIG